LTENRLYYNRTGYFKPEKADEVVQVVINSFQFNKNHK